MAADSKSTNSERGAALIAATWAAFLLSLLAVGVLSVTLSARKTVSSLEADKADALIAKSAVRVFLKQHFYNAEEQALFSASVDAAGKQVAVEVEFESGKININRAEVSLLSALFVVAGKTEPEARSIAAAILDWRDDDDDPEPNGAEIEQYIAAGREYGPRNGPFEALGELTYVLGVDSALFHCVRPLITVSADYDSRVVSLPFAADPVRSVFRWAFQNEWDDLAWPDTEAIEQHKEAVKITLNDLTGQSLTLLLSVPGAPNKSFNTTIRYITTGDYAHIAPVTRVTHIDPPEGCPWI